MQVMNLLWWMLEIMGDLVMVVYTAAANLVTQEKICN